MQKDKKVQQAYHHCQTIASEHYENFPTASLLLKKELRPAVAVIYAFARAADDFADEGDLLREERIAKLDAWEQQLDLCLHGRTNHPVFVALADVMLTYQLPVQLFRDLLIAFRMDVNFQGFDSLDALKLYSRYSANPIGRLMLALHKIDDAAALTYSDAICTGLQLTNFWQDFNEDLPQGRCYLAVDWLETAGVSREELLAGHITSEQLRPAIHEAMVETQSMFDIGHGLLPYLPCRLRLQIAATLAGGMAILHATSSLKDPLHQRPTLRKLDWFKISIDIGWKSLFPHHVANKRGGL